MLIFMRLINCGDLFLPDQVHQGVRLAGEFRFPRRDETQPERGSSSGLPMTRFVSRRPKPTDEIRDEKERSDERRRAGTNQVSHP
jgi:hypothetical protein